MPKSKLPRSRSHSGAAPRSSELRSGPAPSLEIRFYRDASERLSSFRADGHAGYADPGDDIVCAGASAILQAAYVGLRFHLELPLEERIASGAMFVRWPSSARDHEGVVAIVRTAELAIENLARQFPEHIRYRREHEPDEIG